MRTIATYRAHQILEQGCCGNTLFAVSSPKGIIVGRDFATEEEARDFIDARLDPET